MQRQAVALPCVLGLRHKHTKGTKHTLALPPSAATSWGGRVRWEVAVVQAFGATFPQIDAERAAASIGTELLEAVAEARRDVRVRVRVSGNLTLTLSRGGGAPRRRP